MKDLNPLLIDFETQSQVPISNPLYVCHETTKAICMSWGFLDGEGKLWWAGEPCPQEIVDHVKNGGMIGASYAAFDRQIWNNVATEDNNFPAVPIEQWFCTQAQCRVAGLPSSLDDSARALKLRQRKDSSGSKLIAACCVPPFSQDPQDYADLGAYCLQDWVVMRDEVKATKLLSGIALEDYHLNERINDRGVRIDRELATAALKYADKEREEIDKKIDKLTRGRITRHTQHKRVTDYLIEKFEECDKKEYIKFMVRYKTNKETGETVKKYSSDKNVRANLLAGHEAHELFLPEDVKELLELKDEAGGSAVSKFAAMLKSADPDDDRVRGLMIYAGAPSTLRFSSKGLQVHNFRREAFSYEEAKHLKSQLMHGGALTDLEGNELPIMDTLGKLLRAALIPAPGKVFVVGDWNAVESRMTAYVSGEETKLKMFRQGGDPYCYAAEGIYGYKVTKDENPSERDIGKVTDLACGFLGGDDALLGMAATYRVFIDPDKVSDIVKAYRASHPKTVAYGDALMDASKRAIQRPGKIHRVGSVSYVFDEERENLYCTLTGGINSICYPQCRIDMKPAPWDETKLIPDITALKAAFKPSADATEWPRSGLWRGRQLENVVQGNCCQLLREKLLFCEQEGLPVVFHVHDEIVCEVDEDKAEEAKKLLKEIMEEESEHFPGLPLKAEPEIMRVYGK